MVASSAIISPVHLKSAQHEAVTLADDHDAAVSGPPAKYRLGLADRLCRHAARRACGKFASKQGVGISDHQCTPLAASRGDDHGGGVVVRLCSRCQPTSLVDG